ncbi:hypothetical protein GCM10009079_40530 [Ralstonia mannitolilytica]
MYEGGNAPSHGDSRALDGEDTDETEREENEKSIIFLSKQSPFEAPNTCQDGLEEPRVEEIDGEREFGKSLKQRRRLQEFPAEPSYQEDQVGVD